MIPLLLFTRDAFCQAEILDRKDRTTLPSPFSTTASCSLQGWTSVLSFQPPVLREMGFPVRSVSLTEVQPLTLERDMPMTSASPSLEFKVPRLHFAAGVSGQGDSLLQCHNG